MDLGTPIGRSVLVQRLTPYRRSAAALSAAVAVVCSLTALRPATPATVRIWTASRDLAGGAPLEARDLRAERLPTADVPTGAFSATRPIAGRMLAAPVRRGEPLTDVRLLSTSLLSALGRSGLVAVPVRVTDGPATTALVQPGDRVDVLAAADPQDAGAATTTSVVRGVRVLAVPGGEGGLVVVAATTTQAAALAGAASGARLSVAVRGDMG
jgi:pilus assembly protein CpaB